MLCKFTLFKIHRARSITMNPVRQRKLVLIKLSFEQKSAVLISKISVRPLHDGQFKDLDMGTHPGFKNWISYIFCLNSGTHKAS